MYMYMYFVDTFCSLREFLLYLGCNVQCPHLMLVSLKQLCFFCSKMWGTVYLAILTKFF